MQTHSTTTGRMYDSWEELVADEANGFAVVSILQRVSAKGKTQTFARTTGPFRTQEQAKREAAKLRRQWKKLIEAVSPATTELLAVTVEPLWSKLDLHPQS